MHKRDLSFCKQNTFISLAQQNLTIQYGLINEKIILWLSEKSVNNVSA